MTRLLRGPAPALVALAAVGALLLAACGGASAPGDRTSLPPLPGNGQTAPGHNDINPKDPATLADGGDFRFPLDALPDNYNLNEFDGTTLPTQEVLADSVMPVLFRPSADGTLQSNQDYLADTAITKAAPLTITYTLNPKAVWDNGSPITWQDFRAQWQALSGHNPAFHVASTTGYSDIASVERGQDDRQVVVTFGKPFGDWKALFSPLYPAKTNSDPHLFNDGWATGALASGGPFKVQQIDQTAKTVVLSRNEKWWGATPRLTRIIFRVVERSALPDALANGELDFYPIGSSTDLYARARNLTGHGVVIRQALQAAYAQIVFNGAPGAVLSDQRLRLAVRKGIDVQTVIRALVGKIAPDSRPVGNLLYLPGNKNYQDHSGPYGYNPQEAARELDDMGWKLDGAVRTKNGRRLQLRYVIDTPNPITENISALVQNQLKAIGVELVLQPVPRQELFKDYVYTGNFDLTGFAVQQSPFPLSDAGPAFSLLPDNVQQNYGRVGNAKINDLFERVSWETNDNVKTALAQQLDQEIWQAGGVVPLFQYPGAVAVSDKVANFGASGLATDTDWTRVGLLR